MAETKQAGVSWSFGRGRGFRPSQPYKPSRRPGEPAAAGATSSNRSTSPAGSAGSKDSATSLQKDFGAKCTMNESGDRSTNQGSGQQSNGTEGGNKNGANRRGSDNKAPPNAAGLMKGESKLKTKYSYKANPESPLGQKELTIQQGAEVVFVEKFPDNEMWWKVRNEGGQEGYVPASYLEVKVDKVKVTQLPWLAAKQSAEDKELPKVKPEWKPYVSAYNREGNVKEGGANANKEQYYCKWCDKQLNGPKPYGAHMTSKAHKEEIQLAKEYGTYTED